MALAAMLLSHTGQCDIFLLSLTDRLEQVAYTVQVEVRGTPTRGRE